MATTNLNIRTDKEVKAAAEKIFDELGINMTTAINIFLRQTVRTNGIPFELRLDVPNAVTAQAINEGRRMAYDKEVTGYTNMADLEAALAE
jgi:DNA-damage-inducible protein J